MRFRAVLALGVSSALIALTALNAPGSVAVAPATCPAQVRAVDAGDVERVWATALPRLESLTGPSTYPFGQTGDGPYRRTNAFAWTAGFFPAMLWLAFARTSDPRWRDAARRYTERLLPVAAWRGSHDLGFMIGLPMGLAIELDPARAPRYRAAMRTAARSLSTRWSPRVGALRSGTYGGHWGLIVDSAMNAPMLIEQGLRVGGPRGRRLAARGHRHLLTLARDFVRADGSTIHRQAYDPRTGRLLGPVYGQGRSATSTWSRGQAWAIAGFARGYALTGDARLLDAARRVADHWVANVPAGCVPAWDLADDRAGAPRDSSAATIAAYGLLVLARAEPDPTRARTFDAYARADLGTLTREPWVATAADGGPGVLRRQAYNIPADRREGTYVWGDAYLLAALRLAEGHAAPQVTTPAATRSA